MAGKHKGEPTDRPWDDKKDRDTKGNTGDGERPAPDPKDKQGGK